MKAKLFSVFLVLAMSISAGFPMAAIAPAARGVAPFIAKGPQAIPADVVSGDYGLFTCQVGLVDGVACYDPYQMQHAYGVDALIADGYAGAGRTIVIVDAYQSPTIADDLAYFDAFYGLPDPSFSIVAPDGLTPFDPTNENMVGWSFEITLDVEWAHAIAPEANIVLVLAKSNDDADILSATKYAVDNNLGDVISQSFGEDESCMDPTLLAQQHQVFADATRKNITLFASSGDQGAAQPTCDGNSWNKAASSPASDPLVTAVGGTELHAADYCLTALGCDPSANPAPGTYQDEIVWNEFDIDNAATGGGFSVLYDQPSYQKSLLNQGHGGHDDRHGQKQRGVPDVSYNAAIYHGVLTFYDIYNANGTGIGSIYLVGGTSAGSPQWAAIAAIADQKAGKRLGFINKALYQIGQSKKNYANSFFDITSGNNSVIERDSDGNPVAIDGFEADNGWDATTGLGSPSTPQLVNYLIKFVSPGDGKSAIAESNPHGHDHNDHGHHHMGPH